MTYQSYYNWHIVQYLVENTECKYTIVFSTSPKCTNRMKI